MGKLRSVDDIEKPSDCEKWLESHGAEKARQSGSHAIWRIVVNGIKFTFCIPMHNKPLKPGLRHSIIKDFIAAGLHVGWWFILARVGLAIYGVLA